MAKRRKVTGTATTLLWVGAGVLGVFAIYELMKSSQPATTVIKTTTPASSSAATTAAEVTAGATVLTSIATDLFGDDTDS